MKAYLLPIILLTLLIVSTPKGLAQEKDKTITVTGTSVFNLSPNEVIVKISFQEYFLNNKETSDNKVAIETLEKKVRASVNTLKIDQQKITVGSAQIVRPYKNGIYQKRRLNKSLFVCLDNIEQYVNLTRALEKDTLFDKIITGFSITELRHTQKKSYETKSRGEAYKKALEKAELIISQSPQNLGKVIRIRELNKNQASNPEGSFYSVENSDGASGFTPIIVSYTLEVTFEIIE